MFSGGDTIKNNVGVNPDVIAANAEQLFNYVQQECPAPSQISDIPLEATILDQSANQPMGSMFSDVDLRQNSSSWRSMLYREIYTIENGPDGKMFVRLSMVDNPIVGKFDTFVQYDFLAEPKPWETIVQTEEGIFRFHTDIFYEYDPVNGELTERLDIVKTVFEKTQGDVEPIPRIYEIYDGPIEVINTEAASFKKGAGMFKYVAQNGEMRYVYLPPVSETSAMTEIPVIPLQKSATVVPLRGFAISTVAGMGAVAASLLIINGAEYAFDKEFSGFEEAGIMGGIGALTMVPAAAQYGIVTAAAAGGGQFLIGLPISLGIALEEQAVGIDPSSTEGILINAGGTIGLTYLASTATLPAGLASVAGASTLAGGTAAVTAGEATAGGLALAGLGSAGIVAAFIVGGVVVYFALEYGVGHLVNEDGDGTLSGAIADGMQDLEVAGNVEARIEAQERQERIDRGDYGAMAGGLEAIAFAGKI